MLVRLISLNSQALTSSSSFCFSLFLFVSLRLLRLFLLCWLLLFLLFLRVFLLVLYLRSLILIQFATARILRVLFLAFWIFAHELFVADFQFWVPLCTIQARFRSASFTSSGDVFLPWRPSNYMLERISKISLRENGTCQRIYQTGGNEIRQLW